MAVNPSIVQLTPDCGLRGGWYGAEAVILSGPIDALIDLSTSLDVHFIPPKANEDTPGWGRWPCSASLLMGNHTVSLLRLINNPAVNYKSKKGGGFLPSNLFSKIESRFRAGATFQLLPEQNDVRGWSI